MLRYILWRFVVMIPKKEILMTDLRVEDAVKFIVSGGMVNPHDKIEHLNA